MNSPAPTWRVTLACGGTGGHLFPGLAVAHELRQRGAQVTLVISPKEVDQHGVRTVANDYEVITVPMLAFSWRRAGEFIGGWWRSYRQLRQQFSRRRADAVLAMGGFLSTAPVMAGRKAGALTFLHESNTIPGRANRWLSRWVNECFVGFPEAATKLSNRRVTVTGTPVRAEIRSADPRSAREALGLASDRSVLLIMGGSQGALGVNQLVLAAMPEVAQAHPEVQWIHLTGTADFPAVDAAYRRAGVPALVRPFSQQMDQLLAAATVAVSRSGASSLAELAARRLPAVLIPYPAATDDHQRHNAEAFVRVGAARMLSQRSADGPQLAACLDELLRDSNCRSRMMDALEKLDAPGAAAVIANRMCDWLEERTRRQSGSESAPSVNRSATFATRPA